MASSWAMSDWWHHLAHLSAWTKKYRHHQSESEAKWSHFADEIFKVTSCMKIVVFWIIFPKIGCSLARAHVISYSGQATKGGVDMLLAECWVANVLDVVCISDRINLLKLAVGKNIYTTVSVYTLQSYRNDAEIPTSEILILWNKATGTVMHAIPVLDMRKCMAGMRLGKKNYRRRGIVGVCLVLRPGAPFTNMV